jgi:CO/xanthine dehydrogenase FAD-binding subunit
MRAVVPDYHMVAPADLASALTHLRNEPGRWTPFAGGTDLMVVYEKGQLRPGDYLSLHRCSDLKSIEVSADAIVIGALATYADVRDHPIIREEFPMLAEAARESGAIAIQNRGTLGGNIMNASPAADSPPALLAYGADIELADVDGRRVVPYDGFHMGYKRTVCRPDELLTRIILRRDPPATRRFHFYEKVGTRAYQAISKVCFAATATLAEGGVAMIGIGLGSVGPTVVAPRNLLDTLRGASLSDAAGLAVLAGAAMARDITPIDDIRSTAGYRLRVSQNLAMDLVHRLVRFAASN